MIKGGVVLVTDKYKRLPFFHYGGDGVFVPKPIVYSNVNHVKMQIEFCRFMLRYYPLLKDNFDIISVGDFDDLFNRLFSGDVKDEFNVYALFNSVIYNKFCDKSDLYSYIDFLMASQNSPFKYRVGDSFVTLPLDFVDKGSDKLINSLPKDSGRLSDKRAVSVIKRVFTGIFNGDESSGRVYFSNILLVYPMIKYTLVVTTKGSEANGVLLEFDGFENGVYILKPVSDVWLGSVKLVDEGVGSNVDYVHFCGDGFVNAGGKKFKVESLEFQDESVIINGTEKVGMSKKTGISNVRIVFY